jgi:hypothetical protein
MTESKNETAKAVRQLSVIAALLVIGYCCNRTLCLTLSIFNTIFACAYYAVPFLAIRPVLRLHQRPRVLGLVLLAPLLLFSAFLLLRRVVIAVSERTQTLQTFQQGSSTIQLQRYENGGAVGVHGLNLEQRRLIDSARKGTLSVEGLLTVRVHAVGNYYSNDYQVDKIYHLKPWVYF